MEQLPREIERAARYGRQLAVIMCDVDHFKSINDTYGHQVGDEVLKWFVARLQKGVRACDWVARYGGEEFLIVLPETNVSTRRRPPSTCARRSPRRRASEWQGIFGDGQLRCRWLEGQCAAVPPRSMR